MKSSYTTPWDTIYFSILPDVSAARLSTGSVMQKVTYSALMLQMRRNGRPPSNQVQT
jgi:hypothetical protein